MLLFVYFHDLCSVLLFFVDCVVCLQKPKSLIVVGAGYIACELAFYSGGLGVPDDCACAIETLRNEDSEVADEFGRVFSKRFNTLHMKNIVCPFRLSLVVAPLAFFPPLPLEALLPAPVPISKMLTLSLFSFVLLSCC